VGGVKVLLAFGNGRRVDARRLSGAIQQGVDFMLSVDPAQAAYPTRHGRSRAELVEIWLSGFYVTDLLQLVERWSR